MRLTTGLLTLVLMGCRPPAPAAMTVVPQYEKLRHDRAELFFKWFAHTRKLAVTLTNTSQRPIKVVAMWERTTNVESIRCSGKVTPFRMYVAYVTDPSGAFPQKLLSLDPGHSATYHVEVVSDDGQLGYRVEAPGRCKIWFRYVSPEITGESWTARSTPLVLDLTP